MYENALRNHYKNWIILYLVYVGKTLKVYLEKEFSSTKVIIGLSHDQVVLFKTFCGITYNCAKQTINHTSSRMKQASRQVCD